MWYFSSRGMNIMSGTMCRWGFLFAGRLRRDPPESLFIMRTFSTLQPIQRRPLLKQVQRAANVQCDSKRYLHPFVVIAVQQMAKFVAIITGRGIRKWWASLPPNKRQYVVQRLRENRKKISIGFCAAGTVFTVYYVSHLQRTPITDRLRFIAFNEKQILEIAEFHQKFELEELRERLLPGNHPHVRRVKRVAERLLEGNRDLPQIFNKSWTVSVVNTLEKNAFVLPNGQIFVFKGMLDICDTDDELGCILAHEVAHAVLNHSAENLSYAHLLDLCVIVLLGAIWAMMPSDGIAAVTHWFFTKVVKVMLHLPYSRKVEAEADIVGLEMAAKACFDVRHSSAFWAKMAMIREFKNEAEIPEFLSTHPADERRSEALDAQMSEALRRRVDCHCPPLPRADPRLMLEGLRHQLTAVKTLQELNDGVAVITIR